jgi:large subunit ribosomal protein L29
MKKKELEEIKDRGLDELALKERDLLEALFKLQVQKATGQLEQPNRIKEVRRDIARVKTFQRLRELEGERS